MDHNPNANKSDIRQWKTWLKQTIMGGLPVADEAEKFPIFFLGDGVNSKTTENHKKDIDV